MTGPLGDFSYYDENLNKPKEGQQKRWRTTKLFDDDIISPNNSYLNNLSNWVDEKNRVSSMNLSDENKHQYMSCLAAKGNPAMMATGIAGGIARELDDYRTKLFNTRARERYNGASGVWMDGSKDLKNNFKGLGHGYDGCNDCQSLLYRKLP